VKSEDLKFLLIPFYMGDLLTFCRDLGIRKSRIEQACRALRRFISVAATLEIPKDSLLEACKRVSEATEASAPKPLNPNDARNEKIARHKRGKEIRERLELLEKRKKLSKDGEPEEDNEAEEREREAYLLLIEQSLIQALNDLPLHSQELEMLAMREQLGDKPLPRDAQGRVGPALAAQGRREGGIQTMHIPKGAGPLGPQPQMGRGRVPVKGHAMQKREALQANVFRDANPYTMTVQEWGEIEAQRAEEDAAEQARRGAEKQAEEDAMDADEKEERDRLKKSGFDDWKDEHPKGSGNKGDHYFNR